MSQQCWKDSTQMLTVYKNKNKWFIWVQFFNSCDMYAYDHACNALNQSCVLWMSVLCTHTKRKEKKNELCKLCQSLQVEVGFLFVCLLLLFFVCFSWMLFEMFDTVWQHVFILIHSYSFSDHGHSSKSQEFFGGGKRIFVWMQVKWAFFSCWCFCTEIGCFFFHAYNGQYFAFVATSLCGWNDISHFLQHPDTLCLAFSTLLVGCCSNCSAISFVGRYGWARERVGKMWASACYGLCGWVVPKVCAAETWVALVETG